MTTQEYLEALERVRVEGAERIASAETEAELTEVRNTLVGRKSGRLSHLMRELASLPESDRREVTLETKRRVLRQAMQEQWLIFFEHDALVESGRVAHDGKSYKLADL